MENGLYLEQLIKEFEDFFNKSDEKTLYKFVITRIEKPLIEKILKRTKGNKLRAARILGINRNTLHYKIKKLGIEVVRWKNH